MTTGHLNGKTECEMTTGNLNGEIAWEPSPAVKEAANLTQFLVSAGVSDYQDLLEKADKDPGWFWDQVIRFCNVRFFRPFHTILDRSRGNAWARWCVGGTFNVAFNCLDQPLIDGYGDELRILWQGENGAVRKWTHRELAEESGRLAQALVHLGVGPGDAVGIYMPQVPEAAAAFLGSARLGAVAVPLFSGLGSDAIASRLNDVGAKVVITVDGFSRKGRLIPSKSTIDEALKQVPSVHSVIVARCAENDASETLGRDYFWSSLLNKFPHKSPILELPSEHSFEVIYTSGTTGRPKGCVLSHVGLFAKNLFDHIVIMDWKRGDKIVYTVDPGWIGFMGRVMASCVAGTTSILLEGAPDYPTPDRMLNIVDEYQAQTMNISPTLARGWMKSNVADGKHLSSLRTITSGGEPWDSESWFWTFNHICKKRIPILNITGGTEIGANILGSTLHHALKPCSFSVALPGMGAAILNEDGSATGPNELGELCMRVPSIGLTRGLFLDPERYLTNYWSKFHDIWNHGDLASRDDDGFWFLHGRSDDIIKVAGKRLGPAEIESLLLATGQVTDVACVGIPDPLKGSAVVVACVLAPNVKAGSNLSAEFIELIAKRVGSSFRPRAVIFVDDLPRTRTMKVMRREVVAAIRGTQAGDMSTLQNPEAIEMVRRAWTDQVINSVDP